MAFNNLSKKEQDAKNFIPVAYEPHETEWIRQADRLMEFFHGRYYKNREMVRSRFTHNSIFSIVNLLLPSFVFTQPYIRVRPATPRIIRSSSGRKEAVNNLLEAEKMEAVINNIYKIIGGIDEDRKAIQDAFFYGIGITKTGYSFNTISKDDEDYVVKDSPFHRRVNPKDFGWHPLATSVDDSTKLVHRLYFSRQYLKENNIFTANQIDKIPDGLPKHVKDELARQYYKNVDIKDFVTIYEVHDQENDMLYYFGGEEYVFLGKKERKYSFSGSDFSLMKFSGSNDKFLGIPLLAMVEDEAMALNEVLTLIVEHFRKFPGQVFINSGAADDNLIERIRTGVQGSIHVVPDKDAIQFTPPLPMGGEYAGLVHLFLGLIDRTLGIPDFKRLTSTTRKSATEASAIQSDINLRRTYFLDKIKEFVLDGVRKVAKLEQQFADDENIIFSLGSLQPKPIRYTRKELKGNWQFDFDIDTMAAINQAEVTNLLNILNVFAQNPVLQPVLRQLDPARIGQKVLKRVNINVEELMTNEPERAVFVDPERENALARSGQPMPQPKKGEDHIQHAQSHVNDLKQNGPNETILNHLAETIILAEQEGRNLLKEIPELRTIGNRTPQFATPNQAPLAPGGSEKEQALQQAPNQFIS